MPSSSATRDLLGEAFLCVFCGASSSILAWSGLKRSSRSSVRSGTFSRVAFELILAAAGWRSMRDIFSIGEVGFGWDLRGREVLL